MASCPPEANGAVTRESPQAGLQGREALCVPWDPSCCFRRACGMLDPAESGSTTRAPWQSRRVGPPQSCRTPGLPPCRGSCGEAWQQVSVAWRLRSPGPFRPWLPQRKAPPGLPIGARSTGHTLPPPPPHRHDEDISHIAALQAWSMGAVPVRSAPDSTGFGTSAAQGRTRAGLQSPAFVSPPPLFPFSVSGGVCTGLLTLECAVVYWIDIAGPMAKRCPKVHPCRGTVRICAVLIGMIRCVTNCW